MSIFVTSDVRGGKIERIYANTRYPSVQEGLTFFDAAEKPKISEKAPIENRMLYYVVSFKPSHVFISRDILGSKPVYFSEDLTISSFKWYFEEEPMKVLPGEVLKISYDGEVIYRKTYSFFDVFEKKAVDDPAEEIIKILEKVKIRDACISFSGGVDSGLLAGIYDAPLISVTASEKEEEWLREAANMLGREIEIFRFSAKDVRDNLRRIVGSIETTNTLQVSIAVPVYFVTKFAKELGYNKVVFGQGADELFGGYKRYEHVVGKALEDTLIEDIRRIGEDNLERDSKIAYKNEVMPILPYLSFDMIEVALAIPASEKVKRVEGNVIRKYVLREAAKKVIPKEIAMRDKKAIQYSTGTYKILEKLAREEKLPLEEYLKRVGHGSGS